METFGIRWRDLKPVKPLDRPSVGLPAGVGVVLARLLLQTKSLQFTVADVVMAYSMTSGLSLGSWLSRLRAQSTDVQLHPDALVIATNMGAPWTSHLYRHRYLYPALNACRAAGDAFLTTIDDTPGNMIPFRF
jgi:hypothetical protein